MRIFMLQLCLILFSATLTGQNEKFPQEWQGKWSGELVIYRYSSPVDRIPMSLKIQEIDSSHWTFHITYGSGDRKQLRPYELEVVDARKGHYRIDEKNGILLDAFLHGECLYERFSVAGNLLTNRLCNIEDTLYYEITAGSIKATSTTGGDIINQDTIPEVKSYGIPSIQKAILSRK